MKPKLPARLEFFYIYLEDTYREDGELPRRTKLSKIFHTSRTNIYNWLADLERKGYLVYYNKVRKTGLRPAVFEVKEKIGADNDSK